MCADNSLLGFPSETSISGSTSLIRDQAIVGAIGEAVERYSAAFVLYEQVILEQYTSLAPNAVCPESLVLYDDAQYDRPKFGYKRPRADESIGWIQGYSLTRA